MGPLSPLLRLTATAMALATVQATEIADQLQNKDDPVMPREVTVQMQHSSAGSTAGQ